jgi:hypothetical protein
MGIILWEKKFKGWEISSPAYDNTHEKAFWHLSFLVELVNGMHLLSIAVEKTAESDFGHV